MSSPVIIGAGSCIIQAIMNQFAGIPGLDQKAELHLSQITGAGRERVPPEILARAAILVEEAAPWQGSGSLTAEERALLPEGCATVTVPTLHFNSLWPLMVADPRNRPEPGAPYGRIPFGMGDRLALKLAQTIPDPAARKAAYDGTEFRTVANLARAHELEVRNCFAREQGCDVRVAAYVMSNFRAKRLYYTHNHPTPELMYFVLCQLFAVPALRDFIKLPYDQLVVLARKWADTTGVFAGEEAPIHPGVGSYFGLEWWRPDLGYRWLGQTQTFDAWNRFLLTYPLEGEVAPAAPPPAPAPAAEPAPVAAISGEIPVGRFLAATEERGAARLVLSPAAVVTRPRPFVDGPVDPALSPYGGHFADPQEASYPAAPAFVAGLPGGAVLGSDGIVVHEGRIVADSFRHLAHGKGAPMVMALGADKAVLHPGMPTASRRLAGSYFCGFSAMWHDQGHWVFGTLPRLVAFLRRRESVPGLRLILPKFAAGSFQEQALGLLGIDRAWIEEIGPTELLQCEMLYVANAFDLWRVSPFNRTAAETLVAGWKAAGGVSTGIERLHVTSPHRAGPVVGSELRDLALALRGFHSVTFEGMSLGDQIAQASSARCIVVDGGAGASAMFFAPRGCRVLELFDPRGAQPMHWSTAAVCGHAYGFQIGVPTLPGPGFAIRNDLLGWALDQMLLAPNLPPPGAAPHAVHALPA